MQDHLFVDGDRRAAFAIADVFLRINGYRITADSQAVHSTLMNLFDDKAIDMEHLVPWLKGIVEPPPP